MRNCRFRRFDKLWRLVATLLGLFITSYIFHVLDILCFSIEAAAAPLGNRKTIRILFFRALII